MKIKIQRKIKSKTGLLAVPVFEEDLKKLPASFDKNIKTFIKNRIKEDGFKAKVGESLHSFIDLKGLPSKLLVIGMGSKKKFKKRTSRNIGAKIAKNVRSMKAKELNLVVSEEMVIKSQELLEGIMLVQYEPDRFKSKKKSPKFPLEKLNLIVEKGAKGLKEAIERSDVITSAVDFVKDLVNSPSNVVDAAYMAKEARRIAKENKYKIVILNEKELKKLKWGGILAVNQGSAKPAKCLVLEYNGAKKKSEKPIVIVGKGVIFDTGGYNIKPTRYIETMHQDMAGAATVLGVFEALKALGVKKNVVGVMPVAENLVSDKAYRPSDIITMFSGLTVEITNTDAEGRLLLGDAIHYGAKFKPKALITIATLTGAVQVATGNRYAGLISNSPKLRRSLQKAGRQVDELGWPLPLHGDYKKKMESKVADLRNSEPSRNAGSSKAAAFLEKFVGKNKWCHIDIGGTAFTDDPREFETKGSTAHGLRMLINFLEKS